MYNACTSRSTRGVKTAKVVDTFELPGPQTSVRYAQ